MNHFDGITEHRALFGTFDQAAEFRDTHGGMMDAPEYIPCGATWRVEGAFTTPVRQMRGTE